MELIPDFIERRHGRAKITYEHPAMEKVTRETYGIMVYQEQIMQIASEMGGFTMGEADTLRRAMGKKDRDLMATQREKFRAGCAERSISKAKADRVWELMEKFAGYGFNKSHSAVYALCDYHTAYFKANYPVEFMAALLTSEMGDTDRIVKHIEECRAMGIRVEPPDVNVSAVRFSVVGDTVRFGLAAIKNVGEAAMESTLRTRAEGGPFASLEDFCARVDLRLVNRRVLESLIKAGAFDSLGLTRAHLLATADAALESGQRKQRDRAEGQASFFDLLPAPTGAPGGQAVGWCQSGSRTSASHSKRRSSGSTSRAIRSPASAASSSRSGSRRRPSSRPRATARACSSSATRPGSRKRPPRAATAWRSSRSRTWTGRWTSRSSRSPTRR